MFMSEYTPDRWMVIGIHAPNEIIYKVFATWGSSYGSGGSWKLNSGITSATLADSVWQFAGHSGSVYLCHQNSWGATAHGQITLDAMIQEAGAQGVKIEIMPKDTDWNQLAYEPLAQWLERGVNNA